MKKVLIVDDEKLFLLGIKDALDSSKPGFEVLTAGNGLEAMQILDSQKIDLVVTDLTMPVADGFELLAQMSVKHVHIPAIVITAHGTPEIAKQADHFEIIRYVEKPIVASKLAAIIREELAAISAGHINGITLPSFLQLVEMERKTCTLTVRAHQGDGRFFFRGGALIDAEADGLSGVEAAYTILGWENVDIDIAPRCGKKKNSINTGVNEILMEGFRRTDELSRPPENRPVEIDPLVFFDLNELNNNLVNITKEVIMALEQHLEALKEIKGYKASGIMTFTGEMLAHHSSDNTIDLNMVGAVFNDIFRAAHEASKKIGLDACRETSINTPKGTIIMRCSGTDAKVHFHTIGIMASDGNQALLKMQMEKLMPAMMQDLV